VGVWNDEQILALPFLSSGFIVDGKKRGLESPFQCSLRFKWTPKVLSLLNENERD
jgi:hypothetical protein